MYETGFTGFVHLENYYDQQPMNHCDKDAVALLKEDIAIMKQSFGAPMSWRYKSEMDGRGPQQMSIHIIDMAQWLVGEIREVVSAMDIVIPERQKADGTMDTVTNDDNSIWMVQFKNGVSGVFESSRAHTPTPYII